MTNHATTLNSRAQAVLDFWFSAEHQPFWFAKSDEFDRKIADNFGELLDRAAAGELWDWRTDVYGRTAEIIVLDQFRRNVFRDTPKAFCADGIALTLAQHTIGLPDFEDLPIDHQKFAAMPFMHAESQAVHGWAVEIFTKIGDANTLDFEIKHKAIIDRFGRYPHRNAILGRVSTPQELAFLQEPDSSF